MASALERISRISSSPQFRSLIALSSKLPRSGLVFKWILYLALALNIRAFPFVWHWRVFWPITLVRLQYLLVTIKSLFLSRAAKEAAVERWFDSITPVGCHPFEFKVTYRSRASIDESDYNMHMSNSSYPKVLDCSRSKAAMHMCPQFLRVGGLIPVAATHFHFIREIPILSKFEVRLTIGAWDEKWFYVIGRFVTKNSSKSKKRPSTSTGTKTSGDQISTPNANTLFHAPETDVIKSSYVPTPRNGLASTSIGSGSVPTKSKVEAFDAAVTSKLLSTEEPDGATLHTISITRCCFKIGRITVPPAIVLATNGLSIRSPDSNSESEFASANGSGVTSYSHANPPPHWANVKRLASKPDGGHLKKLQQFYRGGWREYPEGERWWETALGGDVEVVRKERLEQLRLITGGMESARDMI